MLRRERPRQLRRDWRADDLYRRAPRVWLRRATLRWDVGVSFARSFWLGVGREGFCRVARPTAHLLTGLETAVADLRRYQTGLTRDEFLQNRELRLCVEYALLRAVTASLDLARAWMEEQSGGTEPEYSTDAFLAMRDARILESQLASRLMTLAPIRNALAHLSPDLTHDAVFQALGATDDLAAFAQVISGPKEDLRKGKVITGVVDHLEEWAAFVRVGAGTLKGRLHRRNIGKGAERPDDVLYVGEELRLLVESFDGEGLELTLRGVPDDPWRLASTNFPVSKLVKGEVVGFNNDHQGAFIKLAAGISGLLNASEGSWTAPVGHPSGLKRGETVEALVFEVDDRKRFIGLSVKRQTISPWPQLRENYAVGSIVNGKVSAVTRLGTFVVLEQGVHGLDAAPPTRLGLVRRQAARPGDDVEAEVLSVDEANQCLRIKQLHPANRR